jgi:hypothetical protein
MTSLPNIISMNARYRAEIHYAHESRYDWPLPAMRCTGNDTPIEVFMILAQVTSAR